MGNERGGHGPSLRPLAASVLMHTTCCMHRTAEQPAGFTSQTYIQEDSESFILLPTSKSPYLFDWSSSQHAVTQPGFRQEVNHTYDPQHHSCQEDGAVDPNAVPGRYFRFKSGSSPSKL
jgi:hypothetical protein